MIWRCVNKIKLNFKHTKLKTAHQRQENIFCFGSKLLKGGGEVTSKSGTDLCEYSRDLGALLALRYEMTLMGITAKTKSAVFFAFYSRT